MFIHNQITNEKHINVIADSINNADEVLLAVAYVSKTGVTQLLRLLGDFQSRGNCVKLICIGDMYSTDWAALSLLCEYNVTVRVHAKVHLGIFHPKVWLFRKNENWKMLIGSANFTQAGLMYSVEAGVMLEDDPAISDAYEFFKSLWNGENLHEPSSKYIDEMELQQQWRKGTQQRVRRQGGSKEEDLFEFVKNWIDISKEEKEGISSLWRGWYIIPDHGYVNDELVARLASYLPLIGEEGVHMVDENENYKQLLDKFVESSQFQRERLKLSSHDLFTRQAKNYLIKFGWAEHPKDKMHKINKQHLVLTALGSQVAYEEGNIPEIKKLYTEYFEEYSYNDLGIVLFTRRLLDHFQYLTLREFDYFVTHALSDNEFEWIVDSIRTYRSLADTQTLDTNIRAYFDEVKSGTGKNVYGNYIKKVKHTMSAIAWCSGLDLSDNFEIRERDAEIRERDAH